MKTPMMARIVALVAGVALAFSGSLLVTPQAHAVNTTVKTNAIVAVGTVGGVTVELDDEGTLRFPNKAVLKDTKWSDNIDKAKVKKIAGVGVTLPADSGSLFADCVNLKDISVLATWDTSKLTDMDYMFANCRSLTELSALSEWDTSKVNIMYYTFSGCDALRDATALAKWDTSKVILMAGIFAGCTSLLRVDISGWDTRHITEESLRASFKECPQLVALTVGANTRLASQPLNTPFLTDVWYNRSTEMDAFDYEMVGLINTGEGAGAWVLIGEEDVPIYRLYNGVEHLYVNNESERDVLVARGWKDEGVAFYTSVYSSVSVRRLYNPKSGDHHYTSDPKEISALTGKHGWVDEGHLFYGDDMERVALTRLFKPGLAVGGHLHTADMREVDVLTSQHGWKNEGISFYVMR